jgi:MoaA/NifB/PqqE/SkfB family radical SAM enzyme
LRIRDTLKISFLQPRRKFRLFQIEPTMNCNLKCCMCPWESLRPPGSDMDWKTFEALSRYLGEVEEVDFTGGGEPLLHPRLEDMVRTAKSSGCTVGFSTNVTLLTPDRAHALAEAGLDWIAYSVDGATPETYEKIRVGASFEKVMGNIAGVQHLREKRRSGKPRTRLFFVMMKENIGELPAMVELAKDKGIDQMVAKNLDVILTTDDEKRRVFKNQGEGDIDPSVARSVTDAWKKARDLKLPLRVFDLLPAERPVCEQNPLKTLFVAWDGSVSPCITLSYIQDRCFGGKWQRFPIVRFGNVAVETLEMIWQKPEYRRFRELLQERGKEESGNISESLIPDLSDYQERRCTSRPPQGCGACYYLYGV